MYINIHVYMYIDNYTYTCFTPANHDWIYHSALREITEHLLRARDSVRVPALPRGKSSSQWLLDPCW